MSRAALVVQQCCMATRPEKKALLFFAIVIALGASVRVVKLYSSRSSASTVTRDALESQIKAADSARHVKFGKRAGKGRTKQQKKPPKRVDLDVASEPEIEALRGVGPSLARRIAADRD